MATEALPCSISISWKETQNVLLPNEPERKQQTNGQIQRSVCEQWNTVGAQSLSRDNEACANNGTLLVLSQSVVTMKHVQTMEHCWCSVTQSWQCSACEQWNAVGAQSLSRVWLFAMPWNGSTPGFPVLHHLLEFAQTHVHWIGDAIQPSHPLSPSSPSASVFPSIRVFSNDLAVHIRWPQIGASDSVLKSRNITLLTKVHTYVWFFQ